MSTLNKFNVNGTEYDINTERIKIVKEMMIGFTDTMALMAGKPILPEEETNYKYYIELLCTNSNAATVISTTNLQWQFSHSSFPSFPEDYSMCFGTSIGSSATSFCIRYKKFTINNETRYGLHSGPMAIDGYPIDNYQMILNIKTTGGRTETAYKRVYIDYSLLLFDTSTNSYETFEQSYTGVRNESSGPTYFWGTGVSITIPSKYILCGISIKSVDVK